MKIFSEGARFESLRESFLVMFDENCILVMMVYFSSIILYCRWMKFNYTTIVCSFTFEKSTKEQKFQDSTDDGVKTMLNFGNDDMITHFIYCFGDNFSVGLHMENLKEIILSGMKKYGMKSSILTGLDMWRRNLITKEKFKAAYEGKLTNDRYLRNYEESINDDLESFFENLQEISCLEDVIEEHVESFFLPKLTKEELKLVEENDSGFMSTLSENIFGNADVDKDEMKKSDSTDKYLKGECYRETMILKHDDTLFNDGDPPIR